MTFLNLATHGVVAEAGIGTPITGTHMRSQSFPNPDLPVQNHCLVTSPGDLCHIHI
jgi:hypothetical protein